MADNTIDTRHVRKLSGAYGEWTMTVTVEPTSDGQCEPMSRERFNRLVTYFDDVVSLHEMLIED